MNMHCITAFSPSYTVYVVSAMEWAVSNSVLRGKPYGGVATLIHKGFSTRASCVKCAERHIITVIDKVYFVNVYFPFRAPVSNVIVIAVLDEIESVVSLQPDYCVVLGDDFNTDLSIN